MAGFGFTPLHLATLDHPDSHGYLPTLDDLLALEREANNAMHRQDWSSWPQRTSPTGSTYSSSPLFLQIIDMFQEAAKETEKPSLDLINQCDRLQGWSPLHWATYTGRLLHMRTLVKNHADPTLLTEKGRNILHQSGESGAHETMSYALEIMDESIRRQAAGATEKAIDVNLKDFWGETPLHVAAENSARCCELLLAKGAKRDIQRNDDLAVPLFCALSAREEERAAILEVLSRDRGVHVNMQNNCGKSALFSYLTSIDCVTILVNNGANVSLGDENGMTVIHCAAAEGDADVLETCLKSPTYRKGMKTKDGKRVKDIASGATTYEDRVRELIDSYEAYPAPSMQDRVEDVSATAQARHDHFAMVR